MLKIMKLTSIFIQLIIILTLVNFLYSNSKDTKVEISTVLENKNESEKIIAKTPEEIFNEKKKMLNGFKEEQEFILPDLTKNDRDLFIRIASDTWGYFRDIVDKNTKLPLDHITYSSEKDIATYTTPTNIGLYLISIVCAEKLKFISKEKAQEKIVETFEAIKALEKYNNFLYNYYETNDASIGKKTISSVDTGWLLAGLIIIKNHCAGFTKEIDDLINSMDFKLLYDRNLKQLYIEYDVEKAAHSEFHYGLFNTESRIASYIGIAKGDLPVEHWYSIYRTLPKDWVWQSQVPKGKIKEQSGFLVFKGHYECNDVKFLPTWGGSIFEFAMPLLVLDEMNLSKKGFAINHKNLLKLHIQFSQSKNYPYWGLSPCQSPDNSYHEWGASITATKPYPDDGIFTPHATFITLPIDKTESINNIKKVLENEKEIYGPYGFFDSFSIKDKKVAKSYLCLDQAMILISITNYLKDNYIVNLFHSDERISKMENLLKTEDFLID